MAVWVSDADDAAIGKPSVAASRGEKPGPHMNRIPALCLTSLALLGAPAWADCKNPKTHPEANACAKADAADAKKALDAAFKHLLARPKLDKRLAQAAQNAFGAYAKEHCALMGSLMAKAGDQIQAGTVAAQCESKQYKDRAGLLQSF
jgi:uncharacterized protein YecT (DUF1311 family)